MTRPAPGPGPGQVRITVDLPAEVYQRLLASAASLAAALDVPEVTDAQLIRGILAEVTSEPYLMAKCTRGVREELP